MTMPWLSVTPVASVRPLPLINPFDKVVVGRNTPVWPSLELAPARAVPDLTPAVSKLPLGAAASL